VKQRIRHIVVAGAAAAAAIVGIVLVLANPFVAPRVDLLRPNDKTVTAVGQRLYAEHCAACHGARLEGQANWRERGSDGRLPAPPHDATGHTWHHADDVLFRIVKSGVARSANLSAYATSMPIYEGVLTDAEIVAVLSWIKAQWPTDIQARHDEINRHAQSPR
jgi:mono/diheme cytochrome c family protein